MELNFEMLPPWESRPSRGIHIVEFDFDIASNRALLCAMILDGRLVYVHFGVPCSRWAMANTLNGGTRRRHCPEGDGSLEREVLGNEQAEHVADICILCARHQVHFTIENPSGSYLFQHSPLLRFFERVECYESVFDQCRFGLTLDGPSGPGACRKRTRVVASFREPSKAVLDYACLIMSTCGHGALKPTRMGSKSSALGSQGGIRRRYVQPWLRPSLLALPPDPPSSCDVLECLPAVAPGTAGAW